MSAARKMASSLVSTHWLAEQLAKPQEHLRLLDGSWHMPATKRNPKAEYDVKHIPKAQFFNIDECCDKSTTMDHMIPEPQQFETYVGNLGITNSTHVVVYDNNDNFGLFSAQRVWWTFRVFGHSLVSVLDGGLPKWEMEGNPVTKEIEVIKPEKFTANFHPHLVNNFSDIRTNLTTKQFTVVDARASGRFVGTHPEPRPEIESGHIPGSKNIPFTDLLNLETRSLKSKNELKEVFQKAGVDLNQKLVGSCGTGISACLLALAAFELGKDDFVVYDGSWTEYYQKSNPDERVKSE